MADSVFNKIWNTIDDSGKKPIKENVKSKEDGKGPTKDQKSDKDCNEPGISDATKSNKSSKVNKSEKSLSKSSTAASSLSSASASTDIATLLMNGFGGLQKAIEKIGDNVAEKVSKSIQDHMVCDDDYVHDDGLSAVSEEDYHCLLYTSPSPRDKRQSRMPSSA